MLRPHPVSDSIVFKSFFFVLRISIAWLLAVFLVAGVWYVEPANWTPFKFDVQYDPQLSFPVHAEVDPSSSASDDDVAFDVTDLKFVKK